MCIRDSPYIWNGTPYSAAGTFVDTLFAAGTACDTVATLVLSITQLPTTQTTVAVCANELPYIWNGTPYSTAGTYIDTLNNTSGCDTVAILILSITPLPTTTTTVAVCANELPYIWNGAPYSAAGTFVDTLSGSGTACDTVATLVLSITPLPTTQTTVAVCANELPYIWNGTPYSTAGTYIDTLSNTTGCDTVATLILCITPLPTTTTTVAVCANELPYIWNGTPYSTAGTFVDTCLL